MKETEKRGRGRPRPDSGPLKKVSLELDERTLKAVDRIARSEGMSRGAFVRLLLRERMEEARGAAVVR